MADNRLYIGNTDTLKFRCISKRYGCDNWDFNDDVRLDLDYVASGDFEIDTNLVFFTENSPLYEKFLNQVGD